MYSTEQNNSIVAVIDGLGPVHPIGTVASRGTRCREVHMTWAYQTAQPLTMPYQKRGQKPKIAMTEHGVADYFKPHYTFFIGTHILDVPREADIMRAEEQRQQKRLP